MRSKYYYGFVDWMKYLNEIGMYDTMDFIIIRANRYEDYNTKLYDALSYNMITLGLCKIFYAIHKRVKRS